MKKDDISKLVPLVFVVVLTLISLVQLIFIPNIVSEKGEKVIYLINDEIMFAVYGLIPVIILVILRNKYWQYVFTILLIVALTPFVNFYIMTLSFGIGIAQVDIIALGFLIAHLFLNKNVVNDIFNFTAESEEEKEIKTEKYIQSFEKKFSNKNKDELQRIIDEKTFVFEAVEAAKRLLKDK